MTHWNKERILQMNFSKKIFSIIGFVGFFLLLGAVGNQDLADEMHVYRSIWEDLPLEITGTLMMLVSALVLKKGEE